MMDKYKTIEWRTEHFPWLLAILAVVTVASFFGMLQKNPPKLEASLPAHNLTFQVPNGYISAKSAIVWDVTENRAIFEKNADEPLPLASLTKVMTALTAETLASPTSELTIGENDVQTEGDSGLRPNTRWTLKSLIDYSLVVSSNDGASAIAGVIGADKSIFLGKMNSLAQSIGMTNSRFMNEHGLDKDEQHVGAYGSARDMAILFEYVLGNKPGVVEATKYSELRIRNSEGEEYDAENTNIIANQIPSLIASKTGFTDLAGGNLVIAYDAGLNRPVIISILGSTAEGRFQDVLKLIKATSDYYDN